MKEYVRGDSRWRNWYCLKKVVSCRTSDEMTMFSSGWSISCFLFKFDISRQKDALYVHIYVFDLPAISKRPDVNLISTLWSHYLHSSSYSIHEISSFMKIITMNRCRRVIYPSPLPPLVQLRAELAPLWWRKSWDFIKQKLNKCFSTLFKF